MSQFSLNPRGSAISSHALSVLRPLLRVIAYEKCLSAGTSEDLHVDGDEFSELEVENEMITNRLDEMAIPLQQRADAFYANVSEATALSDDEIAEAIVGGNDPYGAAMGCSTATPLSGPPMRLLATAAQFVTLLSSSEFMDGMTAPRSGSHIIYSQPHDLKALAKALQKIFVLIAQTAGADHDRWHNLQLHFDPSKELTVRRFASERQESFIEDVRDAVRLGAAFLVLTAPSEPLPDVARAVCERTLLLPSLRREHIIEMLRVTHSNTGEIAKDAVLQELPSDQELAGLPLDVVEGAFQEPSTIRVAQALSIAVVRLRKPTGKTLSDIVLSDTVAATALQAVEDIKAWKAGELKWDEVSSSILLYGPPGNGKTLLASALAGSIGGPLIATSYSDCQKFGHQGDMLKALSEKVSEAIRSAPCLFFLDELDSFSERDRSSRRSDYILGVVNGLLEHLTRLNETEGVLVMGATNHPHLVDPAVIRPGRFDLHLEIGNPNRASIVELLDHALGGSSNTFDLAPIADQLLGSSAAQVTALVREAKGLARREQKRLGQAHLCVTADRIAPPLDDETLWRMAVHEAGHLVVAHALGLKPPARALLTMSGGFVVLPASPLESRQSVERRIIAMMGGRAAEEITLGEALNGSGMGPASDLAMATKLFFLSRYEWGLVEKLAFAPVDLNELHHLPPYLIAIAERHLQKAASQATDILQNNREIFLALAKKLLHQRELSGPELTDFFSKCTVQVDTCGKPSQCV